MSVRTPIGLMCFPHLFTPRPSFQNGEPRYSIALLFDADTLKSPEWQAVKKAVGACVEDFFGAGKSADKEFMSRVRLPWRKCDERDRDGFRDKPGGLFIQPWTKNKPEIVDARVNPIVVASDVWSGQSARATIQPFAYDNAGNKGVGLGLNNVQVCGVDGPRLDGRARAKDDFDRLAGADEEDDDAPF